MTKKDRDPVAHYQRGGLECIDAMRAISTPEEFRGYLRLTAFKYLWRQGEKDAPAKEIKKAQDYVEWLHEELAALESGCLIDETDRGCGAPETAAEKFYKTLDELESVLPEGRRWDKVAQDVAEKMAKPNPTVGRCPHDKIAGTWCPDCDGGWARREVSEF